MLRPGRSPKNGDLYDTVDAVYLERYAELGKRFAAKTVELLKKVGEKK